jgi:Dolichyl-phosphate-mannose-protein mannosyltransferase
VSLSIPISRKNFYNSIIPFLFIWLILGIIQASFTGLMHDEAYYWMYSQHLDWGYFHQPPMIAVMIKIGYSIFQGSLGVRFIAVLSSVLVLYILHNLTIKNDPALLFMIFSSILLVHVGNFVAVPDAPLILFTATFLWLFKRYMEHDNVWTSILLGLNCALLLYSKYHGILIIGFVFLVNIKLLKRSSFWLLFIVAILAFFPHIYWQIINDYPSIRFHWVDRDPLPYDISYTSDYLLGQLAIAGPFIIFFLIYALIKYRPSNQLYKTFKFAVIVIYLFFFILSFRSRIEANWTASAILPLILIAHDYISSRKNVLRNTIKWIFAISIFLIFSIRILIMTDTIPKVFYVQKEMHQYKEWSSQISELTGDRPVVFYNKYQYPSIYTYHTSKLAYSFSTVNYPGNQYDLWNIEEQLQNREIILISGMRDKSSIPLPLATGDTLFYQFIDSFHSYNYVNIIPVFPSKTFNAGSDAIVPLKLVNPLSYPVDFKGNHNGVYLSYYIFKYNRLIMEGNILPLTNRTITDSLTFDANITLPSETGKYRIRFAIQSPPLYPGNNSRFVKIHVE